MAPLCLVLSDDLIDASRVIGEGRVAGVSVLQCRDSEALLRSLERKPVLVVLDLHNPGLDVVDLLPSLKLEGVKIIGYGSHVDAARLKSARRAGCDEVLPRSAFFDGLQAKMTGWVDLQTPKD